MGEPDVSRLISVAEASAIIDAVPVAPRTVRTNLRDALGIRLARDMAADRDYPPFDKSIMDGYAVRCEDVRQLPATLKVIGEVAAGESFGRAIKPGEAVAIMTGAPIPVGADGVIPVEDVEKTGGAIRVLRGEQPARYITRRGSDIRQDGVVLGRGQVLGAAQMAVAASVGADVLEVYARPRVAVLSTGSELVGPGKTPGPAQIRDSNGLMLEGLLHSIGCEVVNLGIVEDDPARIGAALAEGMRHDALLVSGGMSMGEYDYVPRLLVELGAELKITKLRIKPGKPFVFAVRQGSGFGVQGSALPLNPEPGTLNPCFIFGLPGNPVSGFVCAVRLASRLIQRMAGGEVHENWAQGVLAEALPVNGPREFYQPVLFEGGQVQVLQWKGSGDLFTLARANALLVREENEGPRRAGEPARVLLIA